MSSSESEQSARKSEEGTPSDRPSARGSTIIVDPGLIAEAERLTESQRPRALTSAEQLEAEHASANGHGAAEADATDGADAADTDPGAAEGDPDGVDLSFEEAERFANAFRASWEPSAPTPSAAPSPVASVASAAVAEPVAARVLVSDLPGANRNRTLALAAAAVAGFLAIALLGWLASRSGTPDHPSSDNPLSVTQPTAPAEAAPAQAAPVEAPAPVQAPAPVPAPALAAPVAAAPVEQAPALPSEPAPSEAAPSEPAPAPEPEPVLVALQITTQPSSARLTLDGSPISNPYEAMHPQGGSHVVEATAPGYQPRNLKIELTKKRSVALELERDHVAQPPKPAAKPAKRRSARATKPAPAKPAPAKKGAAFVEESPY